KLRAGLMPPSDRPHPTREQYAGLVDWLETRLDEIADPRLTPPGLHRLNRAEYANAVRDLLALDFDTTEVFPADDASRGFDNQAGALGMSPALLEAYLSVAGRISRLAIGDVSAPTQKLYRIPEDTTQNYHVEGLPFGTRGGTLIEHLFPVDGEYTVSVFAVTLGNMGNFRPFGEVRGEQLEILIDGERVGLFDWDAEFGIGAPPGSGSGQLQSIDLRLPVSAGPHGLGVTFLATNYAPGLDLNHAFDRSTIETGGLPGFTFYPHVGSVRVEGPYAARGARATPSRARIFTCYPETRTEEDGCALEIAAALARRAYRGFQTPEDVDVLMDFYRSGRADGGFERGIEMAVQRLLADPKFLFRAEIVPADAVPAEPYRISDLELASRLSFFLWSSLPDEELLSLAEQARLSEPEALAGQVERLLADPRSAAFTENFAGQWLGLRALTDHMPLVDQFPDFDDNLRRAMRREMELFFDSLIRENRSVLELLTADYTFLNGRLAQHYGIPGIQGSRFRRVELSDAFDARRGLLGKASLLTVSSVPGRTSPVIRGNWLLTNLLGVPAPDPPPDVPDLDANASDAAGNTPAPTMREQMQAHRADEVCAACHVIMDPIGFALENFDATGRWRELDAGRPIDASATLYDGTEVDGPAELRAFFVSRSDLFVRTVAEKLLTYALGRGVEADDMPVVRSIVRQSQAEDFRLTAIIAEVVASAPFQMNGRAAGELAAAEVSRDEGG
ncbi:MAG TPA: DUF1592 domain-containing protein, partial [Gammaproteobacteria bacterium]|nr:DUF1592 domain-containing protein [Gammaproteobacteria bacterium]